MKKPHTIARVYTRFYRDNRQLSAYVEWSDGSRTEGRAEMYHGVRVPVGSYMGALFDAAISKGLKVNHETW